MAARRVVSAAVVPLVALIAVGVTLGATRNDAPYLENAFFVSQCAFSHATNDDPIRFPQQPGMSHNHTFFGNKSTSARSTTRSLLKAPTNCDRRGDKSAYWVPTLYANGTPVQPAAVSIYYRRVTREVIRPFPPGFRLVAGNQLSRRPQKRHVTYWGCSQSVEQKRSLTPSCGPGESLVLNVVFPACWDGELDPSDATRHVVYAVAQRCPSTHSVSLPEVSLRIRYPALPPGTKVELASGGVFSGHGDLINAWQPEQLRLLVDVCLNEARACGRLPPSETPG